MMAAIASGSAQTPWTEGLFMTRTAEKTDSDSNAPRSVFLQSPALTLSVVGQRLHTLCTKATPLKKEK